MKIRSIDEAQIAARLIKQELEAAGLLGETQAQLAESLDAYLGSLAKELAEILAIEADRLAKYDLTNRETCSII